MRSNKQWAAPFVEHALIAFRTLYFVSRRACINFVACINHIQLENNTSGKLLGVTVDSDLKFDIHVNNLCKKATQKLNALARISGYMDSSKKTIMKAFITSHFSYCPLVWMFHSRELNNKINRIHERSLRLVYSDKTSTFQELLDKDKSVSVHHKNIHVLATEIYKTVNGIEFWIVFLKSKILSTI